MLSWREEFNEVSQLEGPLQASQVGRCRHCCIATWTTHYPGFLVSWLFHLPWLIFFVSCTELGGWNTAFRLFFLAIHDEVLTYHSPSTCFGFLVFFFCAWWDAHCTSVYRWRIEWVPGEAKGQTGTIIYLVQSHNILLNSILPNFFLIVYNKHWETDVPTNWKAVV